jgi:hypothetical protein
MRFASVDSYLPYAEDLTQAYIPLGFFTAFCLQHQLLSPEVEQRHNQAVSQCRFQEGPVSALFVVLGAQLEDADFSSAGRVFADRVLPTYCERYCELFGEDSWRLKDNWDNYQRMASVLVRDLYGQPPRSMKSVLSRVLNKMTKLWR